QLAALGDFVRRHEAVEQRVGGSRVANRGDPAVAIPRRCCIRAVGAGDTCGNRRERAGDGAHPSAPPLRSFHGNASFLAVSVGGDPARPSPLVNRITAPRGTHDVLPPHSADWLALEATARDIAARFGYGEIRTPTFESTELFVRGVGEATDI